VGKKIGIFVAVLAVVFLGLAYAAGVFGAGSDRDQIQNALDEAILASKEGRPGGVLDYLSRNFKVNEEQFRQRDIARTIREMKPSITLANREPEIQGGQASITTNVQLSVLTFKVEVPEVTLKFEKEQTTKFLIFPVKDWKLTNVTLPDHVVEQVRGQFGG
jgi:hypothetical protein